MNTATAIDLHAARILTRPSDAALSAARRCLLRVGRGEFVADRERDALADTLKSAWMYEQEIGTILEGANR